MRYILYFLCFTHVFGIDPKQYFSQTSRFKQLFVGVYIEDLKTGEVLCALNEDHLFTPASIQDGYTDKNHTLQMFLVLKQCYLHLISILKI